MKLTNRQYDIAKTIVTVVVPLAITLISTLGRLYSFDPTVINGTIAAFAAFFGGVLGISSKKYQKEQDNDTT